MLDRGIAAVEGDAVPHRNPLLLGIPLDRWGRIEDERRTVLGTIGGPLGKACMIGIAALREPDPGVLNTPGKVLPILARARE